MIQKLNMHFHFLILFKSIINYLLREKRTKLNIREYMMHFSQLELAAQWCRRRPPLRRYRVRIPCTVIN
jgi:hypothetical protein